MFKSGVYNLRPAMTKLVILNDKPINLILKKSFFEEKQRLLSRVWVETITSDCFEFNLKKNDSSKNDIDYDL